MITADVKYGNNAKSDGDDDWRRTATPWTVTLRNGRRRMTVNYWTGSAITDDPTAADVLESLALDAASVSETFESFCADLGYDTDSRRAERLYNECRRQTERLRRFLGPDFDGIVYASPDDWAVKVAR